MTLRQFMQVTLDNFRLLVRSYVAPHASRATSVYTANLEQEAHGCRHAESRPLPEPDG